MKKQFIVLTLLITLSVITSEVYSQIVAVGSGSYTTQLPPPDAAGRNVNPTGTPRISGNAATKPIVTSDWWTGLLTFDNANLYNYPMSLKAMTGGLVISYTTPGLGVDDTRQPMSGDQPLLVGVSGLSATNPTVSDYSDWTVTASWTSGSHTLNAIIGVGMPFVYFTKGSSDVAAVTINMGSVTVQNEMILVTNSLGGSNFAVYAPGGSTWTQSGTTYTSTLSGKNYFSVAMLPTGASATTSANDFKQYAYVFPGNPTVSWTYDNSTSVVRSTFTVTADKKEGTGSTVLLGLLPHQWAHLASTSAQPGSYYYTTVRGTMKMLASNNFIVENKFKGILPTVPNTSKYSSGFDPGALATKIDQVKGDALQTWTDSYNDGLAMNRLIQVAKIADQTGNIDARNQIINTVRTRLESWFKAEPGENAFLFYYNNTWNTLIGYPAGYYSDANINDHHFHYGYFISAATAVEQFQPGWAANWGGMVNMLVKDAANWDKTDTQFPFLRNFNPYAGHSYACGLLNNEPHGNNQESSSEAMNFNASLINWGTITGNTAIRDLGIYLYTTEQTAIDEYWFNVNNRNFAATYGHPMCARVWNNGYDKGTFWTNDIAAMYGIEMVPMTGASLYLGQNTSYVTKLWNDMKTKTGVLSNTPNDNLWYDVYWSYLAFADPATAITLYNNYQNRAIKNGESDANTYNWLHAFNGAGQIDGTITANYPIAAVFNKAGDKTYIAHNYGSTTITVTYSDGYSMTVPARTMKTSKDISATATLTASAGQIPSNSNVTLTSTVTGTTTKVEFYNGTALIGTKTTAPYTLTTSALPAGKPNFYVKVYNGTNFNLSNVVKVLVGSQTPYLGTAWAIPGTLEAGNYDVFEGGIAQDVSYFDTDIANQAGGFRSPEYVDAGGTTNEGNTVGWINDGEWLEHTVNVTSGGIYDLAIRYASGNTGGGGPFHIELDGTTIASNISVGFTSSDWGVWATKTVSGVSIPAGSHVIRYAFDKGGFNLGKITFTYTGGSVAVTGVTVSPTSVSVVAGSTQQLTATVAPSNATNKIVTWASNNTSIATVNASGLVTAVAAGTATITVTTQDGSKTAVSAITVTSPNIAVTGVTVTPTSASITSGATQQLTATVSPSNATNKTISWSSSNTGVATVSASGLVTAVTVGTATITVTTQDGSKTATSAITVTSSNVAVTGVTVSPATASVTVGATQQLTATIAPSNATNKTVTWSSSNTSVATVNTNGLVTGVAVGTTTITVTTQDGGKTATSAITITSSGALCTGNGPNAPGTSTPDYSWQLTNNANPTLTFIPGTPITGCTYVLVYPKVNGAVQGGFYMTKTGSNFTYTFTAPLGATVGWYFTYQVPSGGERNSSAAPNTATVGGCSGGGNQLPSVSLTVPTNGQTFYGLSTIALSAIASDADGTISKVEFFAGTTSLGVKTDSPYSISWTPSTTGTYSITAVATDNSNGNTTSNAASITVNSARVLTTITVSPATATLTAGTTQQYTASGLDQYGSAFTISPTWNISGTGNSISTSGLLTASTAGTFSVTATQGSVSGTASVTINANSNCQINSVNGDFSIQVTNTANPTITFIPGSPITGCAYVLIYPTVNGAAIGGFYMAKTGSNFTYTVTAAIGATVKVYFTYQVPSGGERNSSANPNTFTVGTCSNLKAGIASSEVTTDNGSLIEVYPIPMKDRLVIKLNNSSYNRLKIYDLTGKILVIKNISEQTDLYNIDVSELTKGIYNLRLEGNKSSVNRLIVK